MEREKRKVKRGKKKRKGGGKGKKWGKKGKQGGKRGGGKRKKGKKGKIHCRLVTFQPLCHQIFVTPNCHSGQWYLNWA